MSVREPPARPSRRDARRNRAQLVAAARAVFAQSGVDASVDEIVAAAGLGTGTLYRHFPNRRALVDAILEERSQELVDAFERALAAPSAVDALEELLERVVELQRRDPVLKELLTRYPPSAEREAGCRAQLERLSEELLAWARAEEVVRPDFTRADLAVLLWSLAPVVEATAEVAPEAWRRHVGFVLDGLAPAAARSARAPALDEEAFAGAVRCLRARRFGGAARAEEERR